MNGIKMSECATYTADIFVGNRMGYNGAYLSKFDLEKEISFFQDKQGENACTVRITSVQFMYKGYNEYGWQISLIRYPRFDKMPYVIKESALGLANHLLISLSQNRVTVVLPQETIMLESPNAEITHVKQPLSETKVNEGAS